MMTVSIIAGWYVLSGAYCALMFSGTAIAEWYVIYYPLKQTSWYFTCTKLYCDVNCFCTSLYNT